MKTIYYDVLPLTEGEGWILRCKANGIVIMRSDGMTKKSFVERCARFCNERSKPERLARLRVYGE